ncbi:MAG: S16 family serine protease [archaeon]
MAIKTEYFIFGAIIILVFGLGFFSAMLLAPEKIVEQPAVLKVIEQGTKSEAEINIVAVSNAGEGLISKAKVEIMDGEGRILFNTNPFVEPDTQYSIETAKNVAEKYTKKSLQKKDVIYSVEETKAKLIGGPSAGAALTIATIAAIENKKVKEDVAITGTIQENGFIGEVGSVLEKATAAAKKGIKTFLIPVGMGKMVVYEKNVEEKKGPGFVMQKVWYTPKTVDLNEAMKEYGMKVIEVGKIEDAVKYAIG